MISIPGDRVAGVRQEERRIFGLELKVLSGLPEVVQDQEPVLIGKIVEDLFRVPSQPVADDVEMGLAMQLEVRLQVGAGAPLQGIVHAPVAAARSDRYAVDLDDEERRQGLARGRTYRRRVLARGGEARGPPLRALDSFVAHIDQPLTEFRAERRVDLDAAQSPLMIEQRQLVGQLPDSELSAAESERTSSSSISKFSVYRLAGP